jgi:hypothetical protein
LKLITRGVTAIVLCYALMLQGCSVAWVGKVDLLLAVAAPALNNILTIVSLSSGKPVNQVLEDKITADAANLKKLAADFAASNPSNAPTACQELQAGVAVLNDDSATVVSIVQSLGPSAGNLPAILAAASVIVTSIVSLIPSCATPAALKVSIPRAVNAMDVNKMVSAYNAVLTQPSGNVKIDQYTKSHKVHAHSLIVRMLPVWTKK